MSLILNARYLNDYYRVVSYQLFLKRFWEDKVQHSRENIVVNQAIADSLDFSDTNANSFSDKLIMSR